MKRGIEEEEDGELGGLMEDYRGCQLVDFEEFEGKIDEFGGFGRDLYEDYSFPFAFLVRNFEVVL